MLHFEGCLPIGGKPELLRDFYRLGLRSVQVTWNGPNELADGVGVEHPGGLSETGRHILGELERLGILIDVSHLAEPGFWDLVEIAAGPIVASHANATAIHPYVRNLSDEQLIAIAETGGYVGACFFPAFIDPEPTLDHLLDHVDHIAELVGIDHLAVGPDYVEFAQDLMAADMSYGDTTVDYGSFALPKGSSESKLSGSSPRAC